MKRNNREYLLIIDGSSLLATSYYATLPKAARKEKDEEKKEKMLEQMLPKNRQGRYINGVRQFFHTLCTILEYQRPTHLAICWDCGKETFRKELFPAYKSNRRITPQTLRQQYETAFELCERLGIRQFRDGHYEADDFAGSIAAAMETYMPVRILTRDKDFFQLISEKTAIWYGMADKTMVREWRRKYSMVSGLPSKVTEINRKVLWEQFGWTPESITMLKSLSGDVSDNIPGVYGMGELRSLKLALHYADLDELYADIDAAKSVKDKKDLAALWRSWGIRKNPLPCLTGKGGRGRNSAREMAYLCYTLGKIRTDLNLGKDGSRKWSPQDFKVAFTVEKALALFESNGMVVQVQMRQSRTAKASQKTNASSLKNKSGKEQDSRKESVSSRKSRKITDRKTAKAGEPLKKQSLAKYPKNAKDKEIHSGRKQKNPVRQSAEGKNSCIDSRENQRGANGSNLLAVRQPQAGTSETADRSRKSTRSRNGRPNRNSSASRNRKQKKTSPGSGKAEPRKAPSNPACHSRETAAAFSAA